MATPPKTTGDSGVAVAPTPRTPVFAAGMPAGVDATDTALNANTLARPDTCNPLTGANPPTAPVDLGSA